MISEQTMLAATTWPEASIAVAGITLVIAITVALIMQVAATIRARMSVAREEAYRKLAEQAASKEDLAKIKAELSEIHSRTKAIERLLKEVS